MQLTRPQVLGIAAAVAVASAGGVALGLATAPDAPPRLPEVAAEPVEVEPVGDGILLPPKARFPE